MESQRKEEKVKKFVILLFSVVIVASLIFAGCAGEGPTVPTKPEEPTGPTVPVPPPLPGEEYPEEILIGCPMHITGPLGMVSKGQIVAGDLALEEINAEGGIKSMGGA